MTVKTTIGPADGDRSSKGAVADEFDDSVDTDSAPRTDTTTGADD